MTKKITLQRKAFQGAKTAAKRGNLFGDDTLKYLSTLNFDEILRYLEEHGFSKEVDQSYLHFHGFYLVEKILNDYLSKTYASIFKYCDTNTKTLLERYYLKYQVHNLMVFVRCRQGGETDITPYLIGEQRRKDKFLKANEMPTIEEGLEYLSRKLGVQASSVTQNYRKSLFDLENFLYQWYYRQLFAVDFIYNRQDERRFLRYLRTYVDVLNARTFLRLLEEPHEHVSFPSLFIPGGTLTASFFERLEQHSVDEAFKELAPYLPVEQDDTRHAPIAVLDKGISSHKQRASELLGKMKFGSPFSHLRYLFEVEREISKLRVLLKGKWMELSQEEIDELLGDVIARESEQVRI